jgi:hypothetical protein
MAAFTILVQITDSAKAWNYDAAVRTEADRMASTNEINMMGQHVADPARSSPDEKRHKKGRVSHILILTLTLITNIVVSYAGEFDDREFNFCRLPRVNVAAIERALKRQGFDPGEIDGICAWRTMAAYVAFSQKHHLTPEKNSPQPT